MKYFPIYINLNSKPILIVGGGKVAMRKVTLLLKSGADINIVSKKVCNDLKLLIKNKKITWLSTLFDEKQLDNCLLCIVATNDTILNSTIFKLASRKMRLVNVVDDKKHCSFIFPSIVDRSPAIIAITSSGKAPVLARLLREKLETLLPHYLGVMVNIAGKYRNKIKKYLNTVYKRRYFWEKIFNGLFSSYIASGNIKSAKKILESQLKNTDKKTIGEVILVGAGPGNADLLTLRALQAIQSADFVLYDFLVSTEVLELVRRDAEKICVGKRAGMNTFSQDKINALLIKIAKDGKRVIRLKGGDPFIFGRGAEEIQAIKSFNIPFQIIPGITSAIGASTYSGIPLTHRDYAQSVIFITGQTQKNFPINWSLVSNKNQTIVFYMGILKAEEISLNLIEHGLEKNTPIAVIGRATYENQVILTGKLKDLKNLSRNVPRPAILIIGKVVELHQQLKWFQISSQKTLNSVINLS